MTVYRYFGMALEDPFNESPAPAAQFHLDLANSTLDAPNDTEVMFEGSIGRAARTHRPGFYSPSGNAVVAVDVLTLGWFLYGGLGGYVFTDSGGTVSDHLQEIYGVNDSLLPSFCVRIGKDNFEHVFSGCVINSLALQIADGYGQLTVEFLCAVDGKAALVTVDNLLLPSEFPLMFHDVTATRDASDVSAEIKTFTFNLNNNLDAAFGRSIGSRYPRRIVANARDITVNAELFFDDDDQIETFWGGSSGPAATGTTEFGMDFVLDAGSDGTATLALPRVIYNTVNTQPTGRQQSMQNVTMKAYETTHTLADAVTDVVSEILATVDNAQDEMAAAA